MAKATSVQELTSRNKSEVFADATASSGAATANGYCGQVTSESLTTAHAAFYALTLTNGKIKSTSNVFVSVQTGSNTTVGLLVGEVTVSAGQVVINILNNHASAALNGTIKISYLVL